MAKTPKSNKPESKPTGLKKMFAKGNLLTSVVLVMPLLVFYEIGVLFTSSLNGADLITTTLVKLLGRNGFIWVQVGLIVVMAGLVLYLRRKEQFELKQFIPVLIESGIYALLMGTLIVFVMVDLLKIDPRLMVSAAPARGGVFDKLVMSVGAGVHEELVFRLLLMGGLIWAGERIFKLKPWLNVIIALLISSALFSAAHHIGAAGDPFKIGVFVYRLLAGVFFGVLYRYRNFAIAVYTHALYDIYVMIFRAA